MSLFSGLATGSVGDRGSDLVGITPSGALTRQVQKIAAALGRAFDGMKMAFDRFGFPEDDLEKMSNGLVEVLQQAGMA